MAIWLDPIAEAELPDEWLAQVRNNGQLGMVLLEPFVDKPHIAEIANIDHNGCGE